MLHIWLKLVGSVKGCFILSGKRFLGLRLMFKFIFLYTRLTGDLIAVENFIHGGKDGLQQYYNYLGDIEREENWKGFNPDSPYIFIPIYGTGSGEILEMKKVKAEPYSVKHGFWKYYEPGGRLLRTDEYLNNQLVIPKPKETTVSNDAPKKKEVPKTPEMIEWEKKNSGKKKALREGKTSL